jgi:hypothetical protein
MSEVKQADRHKCVGRVFSSGAFHSHSCGKNAAYEHEDQFYCKLHHPPTNQAKQQARNEAWSLKLEEQRAASIKARAEANEVARRAALFPEMLEALQAVIRVADRKTAEFDLAHAAVAKAAGSQA